MEVGDIFDKRYQIEKKLGDGGCSEVWLAKDTKTDVEVALKIFAPSTGLDSDGLELFAREFSLVADVNDPNILKPLYFESERNPYLVLQYCKQGSLKNKIGKITERDAWQIIHDVAHGLKSLHNHTPNPIIHQDIKPENVMIADDGHYMITDFGVSVHLRSTMRRTMSSSLSKAGTRAYMAPERSSKERLTPIMPSDVWSLGAMIFELLLGVVPFGEEGGLNQKSGFEIPELTGDYSQDLKELINRCLSKKASDRPFVEELEQIALKHISINNNNTIPDSFRDPNKQNTKRNTGVSNIRSWLIAAICGTIAGVILAII